MFSIITVAYNNLEGLKKTCQSVSAQKFNDIEHVIIDGGSCDGSAEFMRQSSSPYRLNLVSEPDGGIYDAMNKGLSRASCDYVIFMNAGDVFASDDVLRQLKKIILNFGEEQVALIQGAAFEKTSLGQRRLKLARSMGSIGYGMTTHHQAMCFCRQFIESGYDLQYRIAADYALVARIAREKHSVANVSLPICEFDSGGLSQQKYLIGLRESYLIKRRVLGVTLLKALSITCILLLSNILRRIFPRLYHLIRYED